MSIKSKIKQYGFKNSLRRGLKSILRKIGIHFESFYLMENNINIEELNSQMEKYDYSDVKELALDDFNLGDPAVFTPEKMELIKSRFESGKYYAYGIVKGNTLAYSCWINTAELQFPTRFYQAYPLKSNEGLLQDAYCHPYFRGKGYHSKINLFRLYKLYELHRSKINTIVLYENIPAFKTQLKHGFKVKKVMTFLKIYKRTFSFEKKYHD